MHRCLSNMIIIMQITLSVWNVHLLLWRKYRIRNSVIIVWLIALQTKFHLFLNWFQSVILRILNKFHIVNSDYISHNQWTVFWKVVIFYFHSCQFTFSLTNQKLHCWINLSLNSQLDTELLIFLLFLMDAFWYKVWEFIFSISKTGKVSLRNYWSNLLY